MPEKSYFGKLPSGEAVDRWILRSGNGLELSCINYGLIVNSILTPDRHGKLEDVVLGFDSLEGYQGPHPYFGAVIGRIAGRVSGAKFLLEGKEISLAANGGEHHLHGGVTGFDRRLWKASAVDRKDGADSVRFEYFSPDGEEGYPGNLQVCVIYTVTAKNEWIIETEVQTDKVTPVSLTNHSYFNLGGPGSENILDHVVQIDSSRYVPVDDTLASTGKIEQVGDNDFRQPKVLGEALPGLFGRHGDLYQLSGRVDETVASVLHPQSGRHLHLRTNCDFLQFYTGVNLDGTVRDKFGRICKQFTALCLEAEGYPAGVTHPEVGDILVHPGQPQKRSTIYTFATA